MLVQIAQFVLGMSAATAATLVPLGIVIAVCPDVRGYTQPGRS